MLHKLVHPGQYFDAETGLHYNYFRDYDPTTGRYLQSDPIGIIGGANIYTYVFANPLSLIDYLGLQSSPGLGDQFNFGGRGNNQENYTGYFDARFPKSVSGAAKILAQRIINKICDLLPTKTFILSGLTGPQDDVDISPDMSRFGDKPQNWWERTAKIGYFQFKTDDVSISWGCENCFSFKTDMYVLEHTGLDFGGGLGFAIPRDVRYASWPLSGSACCE